MKNKFLIIGVVIASIFFLLISADNAEPPGKEKNKEVKAEDISVKIPRKLDFAGEEVPLKYFDVHESLERELISIRFFHSQSIYLLKRTERYFSVIEPILKQYHIPDDFKYMAVTESVLFDKAKSPAGAAGVWQLMKGTAQDYGLEVNSNVDERYNLELSTHAVCRFLQKSYKRFGSWTLVAASYNMGCRALDYSMEYSKQDNYYDMYLNSETARYVYRVLAFKCLIEAPEDYGFAISKEDRYPVFKCDTVKVDYPIEHLADFALEYGMTYKTLKIFNPWFLENHLNNKSGKEYKILVPKKGFRTGK